jgi:hypothetical protein
VRVGWLRSPGKRIYIYHSHRADQSCWLRGVVIGWSRSRMSLISNMSRARKNLEIKCSIYNNLGSN